MHSKKQIDKTLIDKEKAEINIIELFLPKQKVKMRQKILLKT